MTAVYATSEPADAEQLGIVRDLMRGQLESIGIAEPDVRVEGENIIVDLPVVEDQESVFDALQVSGVVSLRPVFTCGVGLTTSGGGQDVLPLLGEDTQCLVGPSDASGEVFAQGSARADINQQTGQWVVNVDLRSEGEVLWNNLAAQCFSGTATCPSRQLAIVLDDVIQSAPTVQTPDFPGSVQISGDFSEDEVRSLARVLNRGAFPVQVVLVRTVRPTPTADPASALSDYPQDWVNAVVMVSNGAPDTVIDGVTPSPEVRDALRELAEQPLTLGGNCEFDLSTPPACYVRRADGSLWELWYVTGSAGEQIGGVRQMSSPELAALIGPGDRATERSYFDLLDYWVGEPATSEEGDNWLFQWATLYDSNDEAQSFVRLAYVRSEAFVIWDYATSLGELCEVLVRDGYDQSPASGGFSAYC